MAVEFEENKEDRTCLCKSSTSNVAYHIEYLRGSATPYEFKQQAGALPPLLAGRFTTLDRAQEAFIEYDRTHKPTPQKVVKDRYDARQTE